MKLSDLKFEDFVAEDPDLTYFRSTLLPAFSGELLARFSDGRLEIPEWNDNYGLHLFGSIRDFIKDPSKSPWIHGIIQDPFHSPLLFEITMERSLVERGKEDEARARFESLINGTTYSNTSFVDCELKNEKLAIKLENWQMKFLQFDRINMRIVDFEPVMAPRPVIYSAKVNFPTGKLIIADWLRIDAFIKATKDIQSGDGEYLSINNEEGQVELVKRYLDAGFVSVRVGNSCPSVFPVDGKVVIGQSDFDPDEQDEPDGSVGMVCTDLWWATVIDREDAIRIMRTVHPEYDNDVLGEYIDEYAKQRSVTLIDVEPGEYNLYFNSFNENTEEDEYERISMDQPAFPHIKPNLILSREELSFGNKVVQSLDKPPTKAMRI